MAILNYSECRIDTFLMSCRVIGRKVEDRILAKIYELFRQRGLSRIGAEFIPTAKNQQVTAFYEDHGFSLLNVETDGHRFYERVLV
jgi:predicted enzyme involved in methoxymalonyl-ACP biosynthesis